MSKFIALATCLTLITVFVASLSAEPVNPEMAIKVGDIHLEGQKLSRLSKPGLAIQAIRDYSILEVRELRDNGMLLAYILDLSPEGCIVISPGTDMPPVIAYSYKGRFSMEDTPDNVFFHLVKLDMGNRIEALPVMSSILKDESNELWEKYLGQEDIIVQQLSSDEVWGPWLTTTWHQGVPYNNYCPIAPDTGNRCAVGCAVTAKAQIINYWEFPDSMSFNWENDHYVSNEGTVKEIRIDEDHEVLDFPSFEELSQMLSDIQYDGNEDQIAALCFACGISVRTQYSSSGSSAACWAYDYVRFGYSAIDKYGDDEDFYQVLEQNMKDGRPAWIFLPGHAIVADGFRSTWDLETGDFYHLSFGWGPNSPDPIDECWYTLPDGMPTGSTIHRGVLDIHPSSDLPIVYVSDSIGTILWVMELHRDHIALFRKVSMKHVTVTQWW